MKKKSIKNAEGENVEYYILYPENAVAYKDPPKTSDRNNLDSKLKKSNNKKFHIVTNQT